MISRCLDREAAKRPTANDLLANVAFLQEEYCNASVLPDAVSDPASPGSPSMREFGSLRGEEGKERNGNNLVSGSLAAQDSREFLGPNEERNGPSYNIRPGLAAGAAYVNREVTEQVTGGRVPASGLEGQSGGDMGNGRSSPQPGDHSELQLPQGSASSRASPGPPLHPRAGNVSQGSSNGGRSPKSPVSRDPPALPAFRSSFGAHKVNNFMAEPLSPTNSPEKRLSNKVVWDPTTTARGVMTGIPPQRLLSPKASQSPRARQRLSGALRTELPLRERSGRYRVREEYDEAFRQRLVELREKEGMGGHDALQAMLEESLQNVSLVSNVGSPHLGEPPDAELEARVGIALWKRGIR
ncbi:unnamed protein product [Amoebophrya sp. A25]|nr:unnamed protein product [Amoebophrya sp. A25]|eukprot:GSA25T00005429001.1